MGLKIFLKIISSLFKVSFSSFSKPYKTNMTKCISIYKHIKGIFVWLQIPVLNVYSVFHSQAASPSWTGVFETEGGCSWTSWYVRSAFCISS